MSRKKICKLLLCFSSVIAICAGCSANGQTITEVNNISEISETASQPQARTEAETETVTQTEAETSAETEWVNPALAPALLADRSPSEFTISGSITIYDEDTYTSSEYAGEITAQEDITAIWDFIAFTESSPACDYSEYYSVSGDIHVRLTLENDYGVRYSYDEISFTENGEEAGYIHRSGLGSKDSIYIPFRGCKAPLYSLMEKLLAKEENKVSQVSYPVENYKKGIVLVQDYSNSAWGYQHYGDFVDINGNVYSYDFSEDKSEIRSNDELVSRLMEIYAKGVPESSACKEYTDKLDEITALADKADRRAKLTCKFDAYDAGQYTLYAVNSDFRLIEISSSGDLEILSTDPNALEIQRLCNEINRLVWKSKNDE